MGNILEWLEWLELEWLEWLEIRTIRMIRDVIFGIYETSSLGFRKHILPRSREYLMAKHIWATFKKEEMF